MPNSHLSREAFLARHRNPWGMALRLLTFIGLGWALWAHAAGLAIALVLVDAANWLLMPPRERAPAFAEAIIARELAFLARPMSAAKALAVVGFAGGLAVLGIGLWMHDGWIIALGAAGLWGAGAAIKFGPPR